MKRCSLKSEMSVIDNPYYRPDEDYICDGFDKCGHKIPPKRIACMSTGDIICNGWTPQYCRCRMELDDNTCIWWIPTP